MAGIITGVILVYAFSFCAVMYIKNEISSNNAVQMFDVPQQEVKPINLKYSKYCKMEVPWRPMMK